MLVANSYCHSFIGFLSQLQIKKLRCPESISLNELREGMGTCLIRLKNGVGKIECEETKRIIMLQEMT